MYGFSKIINYIIAGYPYFSLFYVILFRNKIKSDETYKEILSFSNLIFVVLSLSVFLIIVEVYTAWYLESLYGQYASASRDFCNFGWPFYFLFSIISILLPHLFWFKKFRRSIIVTIIVSIVIVFPIYLEYLVPFIISSHRDYLPSKWIYAEPWYIRNILTPLLQTITYGCCVALYVFIRNKII